MVTARDFSTEFPIKQASYDKWKEEVYEAPNGPKEQKVPPAFALKQHLIEEIEKKMDRWVDDNPWAMQELHNLDEKKNKNNIVEAYVGTKVADIVFSFDNERLIRALRARGRFIAEQDFDNVHKIEAQIDDLFNESYLELTVPTSAFITFESEDSANLCNMVKNSNMKLFNQELKFKKCSEPTDIIWENRHF